MIIQVLAKVGSLFFILAVGAIARWRRIITDEALNSLTKIVLYVTLPFLFIYILSSKCIGDTIITLWPAPLFAAAIIFTGFLIAQIACRLLKVPKEKKGTFVLLISFQNSGFLAIPITLALFGENGVLNVVVFNIGFNILYWTLGVWLLSRGHKNMRINPLANLMNPAIIALVLGIMFGVFCVDLPKFFLEFSRVLGDATIPLAMLVVGAILASSASKNTANAKELFTITLCRLLIVPAIFLALAKYLPGISGQMRSIIVLQACMPTASSSPLMARRFGGDYDMAAGSVFCTTLVSIITIPLFMSLI
jgi:predicted permease